jgi:hypothetical protein
MRIYNNILTKEKIAVFLIFTLISIFLIYKEKQRHITEPLPEEKCLFCHKDLTDPDTSHPISAFGCSKCHLGNPFSLDKDRAHFDMVKNPSDLSIVDRTCGQSSCHPEIVSRVKKNIMSTNKGILNTLNYQWEGIEKCDMDVTSLLANDIKANLATEYYMKMCGGCHLWKERWDFPEEIGKRGGGCSDCHIIDYPRPIGNEHPKITTKISSENCTKCHNRSARIGLSYFGKFESEGYGTPYQGKWLNSRELSGNRFFINLPPDIHYTKADMECIDCHTEKELMGDGNEYTHLNEQIEIRCNDCHLPQFKKVDKGGLAEKLAFLNKKIPNPAGKEIAFTKKGAPIYNLQKRNKEIILYKKKDGKAIKVTKFLKEKPYHNMKGHEWLSCQACHSTWMPQCYGCHTIYRKDRHQYNWIKKDISLGMWEERRSYIRFLKPTLGIDSKGEIFPFSPCQIFVSIFNENKRLQSSFKILTMSSFDPHTTQKEARNCIECHSDPKTLGLGEGILYKNHFRPTYDSSDSGLGINFPLDGFVNIKGKPLQITSPYPSARPFNKNEIERILFVFSCIVCHDQYGDEIYKNFDLSKKQFLKEENLPCKKIISNYKND